MTAYGVLLEVAYDGTGFHGWAAQSPARTSGASEQAHQVVGVRTVEETLRGAVVAMDDRASALRGASRTDAGVHAEGQLVAFDASREIEARGWVLGLNQHLPEDVAVRGARAVPAQFSPRFTARGKRYRYRVLADVVRDPHLRSRTWRVGDALDLAAMAREAEAARGTHDFAAFRASGDERADTTRTLSRVDIECEGQRVVAIVVEGDAFLYNMVRILAGTLVDVARGRLEPGAVARSLASKERRDAGTTAPAHGLVLEHVDVELPEGAGERWPR
jgi:tRNA pseudouridine38-40 synthase